MKRNEYGLKSYDYSLLYGTWRNMIKRCHDKNSDRYYTYGARKIKVCEEWRNDFHTFARWALANGWKPKISIERKDVDSGYSPKNCTFITMDEQARNRTNNIRIIYNGEERCISEWCRILNLTDKTIYMRYARGIREPERLFADRDLRYS